MPFEPLYSILLAVSLFLLGLKFCIEVPSVFLIYLTIVFKKEWPNVRFLGNLQIIQHILGNFEGYKKQRVSPRYMYQLVRWKDDIGNISKAYEEEYGNNGKRKYGIKKR